MVHPVTGEPSRVAVPDPELCAEARPHPVFEFVLGGVVVDGSEDPVVTRRTHREGQDKVIPTDARVHAALDDPFDVARVGDVEPQRVGRSFEGDSEQIAHG